MPEVTYDREVLVEVLTYHYRKDIGCCGCGWGVDTGHAGMSHAEHVANVYEESAKVKHDA